MRFGKLFREKKHELRVVFPLTNIPKAQILDLGRILQNHKMSFGLPKGDRGAFTVRTKIRHYVDFSAFLCNRPCV